MLILISIMRDTVKNCNVLSLSTYKYVFVQINGDWKLVIVNNYQAGFWKYSNYTD